MHIDCEVCVAAHTDACDDCVVTYLLGQGSNFELDDSEVEALEALAEEGLVPRLRLQIVPPPGRPWTEAG